MRKTIPTLENRLQVKCFGAVNSKLSDGLCKRNATFLVIHGGPLGLLFYCPSCVSIDYEVLAKCEMAFRLWNCNESDVQELHKNSPCVSVSNLWFADSFVRAIEICERVQEEIYQ